MYKKIIATALSLTMAFGLCSCGNNADSKSESKTSDSSAVTTEKKETAKEESKADETADDQYSNGYISLDIKFKMSNHFDYYWKVHSAIDPTSSNEDDSCFLTVSQLCNEDNGLTVDADKPENWLDTVHDEIAKKLSNGYNYVMVKPALDISENSIVEVNGRKFVRFVGSFYDDGKKSDVDLVGYLTVIKGSDEYSEYKTDNTAGFIAAQYHDKADINQLEGYVKKAAETMEVGKNNWSEE